MGNHANPYRTQISDIIYRILIVNRELIKMSSLFTFQDKKTTRMLWMASQILIRFVSLLIVKAIIAVI